VDNIVALFNVVNPETFKRDNIVVLLFKVVNPETFKVPNIDVLLYNIVNPAGNENIDSERMFSSINNVLDQNLSSSPKGYFSNFTINVKWNSGLIPKTISEGFFFIDNDTFKGITFADSPYRFLPFFQNRNNPNDILLISLDFQYLYNQRNPMY
jgi:hypothetical protein